MISRIEGLTILNSGGMVSRSYRGPGLRRTATIHERDELTTNQPTNDVTTRLITICPSRCSEWGAQKHCTVGKWNFSHNTISYARTNFQSHKGEICQLW